jgi:solute carrier family 25 carnitine/acylcarnitine transporter 20/29
MTNAKDAIVEKLPSTEELKEDVKVATKSSLQSLRALAAGGVGGICAVVVGHPFDLVKVRLQTAEKGVYTGAMDVVRRTIAREGLARGLYAGVSAPLVGVTPMCKYHIPNAIHSTDSNVEHQILICFSRRVFLGLRCRQAACIQRLNRQGQPVQRRPSLRRRLLQRHSHDHHHRTLRARKGPAADSRPEAACAGREAKVLRRRRCRQATIQGSVFRGSAMTLARDGPGSALYFATYETVKRNLTPKDPVTGKPGPLSMSAVMVAGGAAGIAMWIPVFPVDTIKSRLQSAEGRPTISGTIKGIHASGGLKAFFPGIGPAMARAVPANAATFAGVELAQKAMTKMFDRDGE